ncbi:MAG: ABC transporter ATP-binding protein [Verrucomicrobiota bacterium]
MPDPIIQVENLERDFGSVKAVNGVSFEIESGRVIGFIGANGAGKTTTMRMMVTLDLPTAGTIRIGGMDVADCPAEVRKRVGWMPDAYGTYDNMTVWEYLDFYGRAFGYKKAERQRRIGAVMEFTDLTSIADRPMDKLSKGMGQRLCLGRTLIHDPEVLVLDEPAAGLDPKARIEFKNLVRLLAGHGKTIFISSHILSELGEMCDQLIFIDAGRIVHQGTTESLVQSHGAAMLVEIRVAGDTEALFNWIAANPVLEITGRMKNGARVQMVGGETGDLSAMVRGLVLDGIEVSGFFKIERRIEDAFVDMLKLHPPPIP